MNGVVICVLFGFLAVLILAFAFRGRLGQEPTVHTGGAEPLIPTRLLISQQPQSGSASRLGPEPVAPIQIPDALHSEEVEELRRNLRRKVLGREETIDRLVRAERDRTPAASEVECYRTAIEKWEQDNR